MRCVAGRMVMSFVSMKGVPARISTSRFSTTRSLNVNVLLSRVSGILVSPTMDNGDDPSAW